MEIAMKRSMTNSVADQGCSSSSSPTSSTSSSKSKNKKMDQYMDDVLFAKRKRDPEVVAHIKQEKKIAMKNLRKFKKEAKAALNEFVELLFQNNNDTENFDDLMEQFEKLTDASKTIVEETNAAFVKELCIRFTCLENKIRKTINAFVAGLNQEHDESDVEKEAEEVEADNGGSDGDDGDGTE